jgi:hypothetical protein
MLVALLMIIALSSSLFAFLLVGISPEAERRYAGWSLRTTFKPRC